MLRPHQRPDPLGEPVDGVVVGAHVQGTDEDQHRIVGALPARSLDGRTRAEREGRDVRHRHPGATGPGLCVRGRDVGDAAQPAGALQLGVQPVDPGRLDADHPRLGRPQRTGQGPVVRALQVVLPQHGGQAESLRQSPGQRHRLQHESDDSVGVGHLHAHPGHQVARRRPGRDDVRRGQPDRRLDGTAPRGDEQGRGRDQFADRVQVVLTAQRRWVGVGRDDQPAEPSGLDHRLDETQMLPFTTVLRRHEGGTCDYYPATRHDAHRRGQEGIHS